MSQKCKPTETINLISDEDSDDSEFRNCPLTEYEAFESLMDTSRIQNRELYLENLRNLPVIEIKKPIVSEDPYTSIPSTTLIECKEKQRLSANQTYHDFLLHKQYEANRERFHEIQNMGVVFPKDKFPVTGSSNADNFAAIRQKKQCGGENLYDKTVDYLINDNVDEELIHAVNQGEFTNCGNKVYDKQDPCTLGPDNEFHPNIDYLIEDNYYPGLIDDSINRLVDFNRAAFDVYFGAGKCPPEKIPHPEPISLIEAFDLRFEREECKIRKAVATVPNVAQTRSLTNLLAKLKTGIQPRMNNREEISLANALEIDLAAIITNKPISPLTLAIECLQRAEIINDSDKSLQAAEEAYQQAPPDLAESAAVYKADTFKTERVCKQVTTIPMANYRPIEVVSYMGITKPVNERPQPCPND